MSAEIDLLADPLDALPPGSATTPPYFKVVEHIPTDPTARPYFEVFVETTRLVEYLQEAGFGRATFAGETVYVRKQPLGDANKLSVVKDAKVFDWLVADLGFDMERSVLSSDCGRVPVRELTDKLRDSRTRILQTVLPGLTEWEVKPLRDTKTLKSFPFRNGVAEVEAVTNTTGRSVEVRLRAYRLHELFWASEVIDHDLTLDANRSKGEWHRFVSLTQAEDPERIHALRSALGYMLSTDKDPSEGLCPVLTDEIVKGGQDSGGSGKGMLTKALLKLRPGIMIDGKGSDWHFIWAGVQAHHRICVLSDVHGKFQAEQLNARITDVFAVTKKGKDTVYIDWQEAAKLMLTTNQPVGDFGSTYRRRFPEYLVGPYFTGKSITAEFGHPLLVADWGAGNWNDFFLWHLGCVVIYMSDGCVRVATKALTQRKLMAGMHEDFVTFMDELTIVPGAEFCRGDVWCRLLESSTDLKKAADKGTFSQRQMTMWVQRWTAAHDDKWELDPRRLSRGLLDGKRLTVFVWHSKTGPDVDPDAPVPY